MEVQLTKGLMAYVDEIDAGLISEHSWHVREGSARVYAATKIWNYEKGKQVRVLMHHMLMGPAPEPGLTVDHKDGDGLNNRRSNLRWATRSQQNANRRFKAYGDKYKGVHFIRNGRWAVTIGAGGKTIQVGNYKDEITAALAYDVMAKRLHGEFAVLNFPTDEDLEKAIAQKNSEVA